MRTIRIDDFKRMTRDGVQVWNEWRQQTDSYLCRVDLRGVDLRGAKLNHIDLSICDLSGADLREASIRESNLLTTKFIGADLRDAQFSISNLTATDFTDAELQRANFGRSDLYSTKFVRANLTGADFISASFVSTDVTEAVLDESWVWATSVWDLVGNPKSQRNLRITPKTEPSVTVDNLELAQFVRLLLTSHKLRHVIDTVTSRTVLILGRFSPVRKRVLDAIADELRGRDYVPMIFDWSPPTNRNLSETISILAHLARFVVVDITDPRSVPQELQRIVPILPSVPIVPIISTGAHEYGMFDDFRDYRNVLDVVVYEDLDHLLGLLPSNAIRPAETLAAQIIGERIRRRS